MTQYVSAFLKFEHTTPLKVQIGDKSSVNMEEKGDLELLINVSGPVSKCILHDILCLASLQYCPDFGFYSFFEIVSEHHLIASV